MSTISTACSSAANAVIFGANLIKAGVVDIAVVGGAEALTRFHVNGFNTLMILDHEQCKPFDQNHCGINLGEGAAYIVIESEKSMHRRGVNPSLCPKALPTHVMLSIKQPRPITEKARICQCVMRWIWPACHQRISIMSIRMEPEPRTMIQAN